MSRVGLLEFWPDYGPGPLWTADGRPAELWSLGLSNELVRRLEDWNARYAEDKLPIDGPGDTVWLAEGAALLGLARDALRPGVQVVVTEPWWGADLTGTVGP